MDIEYTKEQKRAEELYLNSVCYESDYKPISYARVAALLKEEGLSGSTSAIGRWAARFDWKEKVENIVTAATLGDGEASEIIKKSSLEKSTQKILTDFEANESLKNSAYGVLQEQMKHYVKEMEDKKSLSLNSTKVVIKILELTTVREDKLLDRQAMLSAAKLVKSDDVLATLKSTAIEVEALDIEIDE